MKTERFIYESISFNIETPSGTANITIVEDSPGVIYKIFFSIGKAGTELNALCFAIAELTSDIFNRGGTIGEVLKLLKDITSNRPIFDKSGVECRSVPEALYLILLRYKNLIKYDG